MFELPAKHPARALLAESDIAADEALILRRVQFADGRTRAFVNDQPVSVQALQSLGAALVEIHGQHDARALVDAATHRRLLDAYGGLEDDAAAVGAAVERAARRRGGGREASRRGRARGARGRLAAPRGRGTEQARAARPARRPRSPTAAPRMMQAEKVAGDLRDAHDAVAGSHRRCRRCAAAVRRLERRGAQAPTLVEPAVKALDAALNALDEARAHLEHALRDRRSRSARAGAHRGAAVRAARRRPQIQFAGRRARRAGRALCRRSRADRRRRRTARGAGKGRARGASALRRGRREAVRRAQEGRREARQGGQRRAQAAQARAREILDRRSTATPPRPARTASTASSSGCRPIPARGRAR